MTLDHGLRLGPWQTALDDVTSCDALICDPPYGARTHAGHDHGVRLSRWHDPDVQRRTLSYGSWSPEDVRAFVEAWSPRVKGWFCAFSCSDLFPVWKQALADSGRVTFAPIACVIRAMSVRLCGDGPSNWVIYLNVARPRNLKYARWGTLPGAYVTGRAPGHIGGKPLALMEAIVRDYSKPGDVIVDPCAGLATTLIAATRLNRVGIGAEMDPDTHVKAVKRMSSPMQLDMMEMAP